MARSTITRPGRTIAVLVGLFVVIYGVIAAGVLWSNATWTPKLALDLEGGTQIVLEPKPVAGGSTSSISQTNIDQAVDIIRQRVNGSGVSEAEVTTTGSGLGTKITVALPGKPDKKTEELVTQAAQLRFRAVLATAAGAPQAAPTATATPGAASPSASGTKAPASPGASSKSSPSASAKASPSASGNGRALPKSMLAAGTTPSPSPTGAKATSSAKATTSATPAATPTVKPTDASDENWITQAVAQDFEKLDCSKPQNLQGNGSADNPSEPLVTCKDDGTVKYILGPAEVVGTDIKSASYGLEVNSQGQTGTAYEVDLSFTSAGTKKFADVTTRLASLQGVRNQFAIVLDGLVVSDPGTNEPITTGSARITGGFTLETAQTLANQLKYGALPLSFVVTTKDTITATLGSDSLRGGLLAGLIGLVLVVVYSLVQYRALGLVTVFSLAIAAALTYGLVVLLGWRQGYRLSLPGVAGLIVAIGITADSFIVYFERIRDEVRDGRQLRAAVEAGWARARRTIIASDAVSFLAAVVLYVLAVGAVRGFAFTLGLTTLVDLVVVFLFTHPTVALLARTKFFGGGHKLSGFDPEHLGRTVVYAGRGRVRTPAETAAPNAEPDDVFATAGAPTTTATTAAQRSGSRTTIAERRAAAERAARGDGDEPSAERAADTGAATSGRDA